MSVWTVSLDWPMFKTKNGQKKKQLDFLIDLNERLDSITRLAMASGCSEAAIIMWVLDQGGMETLSHVADEADTADFHKRCVIERRPVKG